MSTTVSPSAGSQIPFSLRSFH